MLQRTSNRRNASAFAILAAGCCFFAGTLLAHTQESKQQPAPATAKPTQTSSQRGERVFMNNCSRCHKPPMTIPQQATGTIVMHMRVRAKLSRQDEQDLLRYLAP